MGVSAAYDRLLRLDQHSQPFGNRCGGAQSGGRRRSAPGGQRGTGLVRDRQSQRLHAARLFPPRDRHPRRGAGSARHDDRRRDRLPRLRRAGPVDGRLGALGTYQRRHDPRVTQRIRQGRQLRLSQLRPARLGRGKDRRADSAREGRPDYSDRHPHRWSGSRPRHPFRTPRRSTCCRGYRCRRRISKWW